MSDINNITLFRQPIVSIPTNWTLEEFRSSIAAIEERMLKHSLCNPESNGTAHKDDGCKEGQLQHIFVDGAYVREITMQAGALFTSQIHKKKHPYFIMQGEVTVLTQTGIVRIKAPYWGITEPGTKRLLYIHTETIWVTVHSTDSKDLDDIEEEIIAKNFEDFDRIKLIEEE